MNADNGAWNVYKNGVKVDRGSKYAVGKQLSYGGRLILGQSAEDGETTDFRNESCTTLCPKAFRGELSYLNIWKEALSQKEIQTMYKDCTFTYCGDAVEWVDFRSGTRNAMKLRWPSKIFQGHEG